MSWCLWAAPPACPRSRPCCASGSTSGACDPGLSQRMTRATNPAACRTEIGLTLNSDEAMAMGAAFYAANMRRVWRAAVSGLLLDA
jgi:hypothetical protein